jgi:hypothetical protein
VTATLSFVQWLVLAIGVHVGDPRTNFDHCVSSRTECLAQYGRETYLWCLFWCRDSSHCRLGAAYEMALLTRTKEAKRARSVLAKSILESLDNGGCSYLSRP